MDYNLVKTFCFWLLVRPSLMSVIQNVANTFCPYNCHAHGDCHVVTSKDVVSCSCHIGWGGDTCDIPCEKPCINGDCMFAGSKQLCLCSPGFKGPLCDIPGYDFGALLNLARLLTSSSSNLHVPLVMDPSHQIQANIQRGSSTCTGNFVCQNGGYCVNGEMGGYKCRCDSSRYTGNFCQHTCPQSCQNGGTCVRLRRTDSSSSSGNSPISLPEEEAEYRCVCRRGYTGQLCQRKVSAPTVQ